MPAAFATVQEAFAWFESFTNFEKKPFNLREIRLERMQRLAEIFGNPQRAFRSIHLAGSKGKGSTATFIAAILDAAGLPTGLYTSPHLISYKERISLAGREIDDALLVRLSNEIRQGLAVHSAADFPGGLLPTTFELLTLLGFLAFRELGCRWAVLETGLGGRLDATNIVDPAASVITPIELEHTEYLGDTTAKIAGEKAGIIKPGRPVYSSRQEPAVIEVLAGRAAEQAAAFHHFDGEIKDLRSELFVDHTRARFRFAASSGNPAESYDARLKLLGEVQVENAALAALVARRTVPAVLPETVSRGLAAAFIHGRCEYFAGRPPVIVDGSHTPNSVARLLGSFRRLFPGGGVLLAGLVAGKRYHEIAEILGPAFRQVIVTTPGVFKASDPAEVHAEFRRANPAARLIADPAEAFAAARAAAGPDEPVLVTGSFYLAGEIMKLIAAS